MEDSWWIAAAVIGFTFYGFAATWFGAFIADRQTQKRIDYWRERLNDETADRDAYRERLKVAAEHIEARDETIASMAEARDLALDVLRSSRSSEESDSEATETKE